MALATSSAQPYAGFSALAFGNSNSPQGIQATNGTEYTNLGNANLGTNFTDNTFLYGDNLTMLKGHHTFKVGVQFMRQQQNNFYPGNDGSNGGFLLPGSRQLPLLQLVAQSSAIRAMLLRTSS